MATGFRRPFEAIDYDALMRAHAPPPEYFEKEYLETPDQIEAKQLVRLKARAEAQIVIARELETRQRIADEGIQTKRHHQGVGRESG